MKIYIVTSYYIHTVTSQVFGINNRNSSNSYINIKIEIIVNE